MLYRVDLSYQTVALQVDTKLLEEQAACYTVTVSRVWESVTLYMQGAKKKESDSHEQKETEC
jgi:hypothetical protein